MGEHQGSKDKEYYIARPSAPPHTCLSSRDPQLLSWVHLSGGHHPSTKSSNLNSLTPGETEAELP